MTDIAGSGYKTEQTKGDRKWRDEDHACYAICEKECPDGIYADNPACVCTASKMAMKRLLEYEDTGLTPEQIRELKERDVAQAPIKPKTALDAYYHEPSCPNCGREFTPKICGYKMSQAIGYFDFCP